MKIITADEFIESWGIFSKEITVLHKDWLTTYQSDKDWTQLILGNRYSSNSNSFIGNFFKKRFNLNYWTEDGSFDISLFSDTHYETEHCYIDKKFYPRYYDIIIELENNNSSAWQEMVKLTWVKSYLKILVTYNNKLADENEKLSSTFCSIISQSNCELKENDLTKYILLIGNDKNQKLNWTFFVINTEGNIICESSI